MMLARLVVGHHNLDPAFVYFTNNTGTFLPLIGKGGWGHHAVAVPPPPQGRVIIFLTYMYIFLFSAELSNRRLGRLWRVHSVVGG